MKVTETGIGGLRIVEPDVYRDERGFFSETYNAERYAAFGIDQVFVQDNESVSRKGTVRGLHWQTGEASQAKLVRAVRGAVWDVAVDMRRNSPTFGRHFAVELTGENRKQLLIPRGFAHGFIALEDDTVFAYKCDRVYCREAERGMRFDDPALGFDYPALDVPLTFSEKDRALPFFRDVEPEADGL
jgi:dTDP-4-dehydrorhamnose 3,5-epimerase